MGEYKDRYAAASDLSSPRPEITGSSAPLSTGPDCSSSKPTAGVINRLYGNRQAHVTQLVP